jgi:hypothetical protein
VQLVTAKLIETIANRPGEEAWTLENEREHKRGCPDQAKYPARHIDDQTVQEHDFQGNAWFGPASERAFYRVDTGAA